MIKMVKLFGIPVADITFEQVLDYCWDRIKEKKQTFIITLNALMVNNFFRNKLFRKAVKEADLILSDGYGLLWASQVFKTPVRNHLPGIDLVYKLLGLAYEKDLSVFIMGSHWDTIDLAFKNLKKWYPKVKFVGRYSGYFNAEEEKKVILGINKVQPDILLVGMGSPRQETWITENRHNLKVKIMIGIGGSFEIFSGKKKRAPESWRERKLEWLYRSLFSPGKTGSLLEIVYFGILTFLYKITGKYLKD